VYVLWGLQHGLKLFSFVERVHLDFYFIPISELSGFLLEDFSEEHQPFI
jgi:hypothetical protein